MLEQGALDLHRDPANGLVTGTTLGSVTDSYTYDEHGDVERYTASFDGAMILDLAYVRDDLDRIEQITETIAGITRVFEYTYFPAGQLETVSRDGTVIASYTYDDNGNRLTESGEAGSFTATYDDRDRLLSRGGAAYTYSPAGDLIAKMEGGLTTYQYDPFGNLSAVTLPDGRVVEFVMDASRKRIGKIVDGVVVQRRLYGKRQEVVAELDVTGAVETRYVYVNRLGAPAYMERDGRTYRILSDHLGGVRLAVDVLTGAVEQRLDYDAWGNILTDSNPGFQAFAFTGREWDPETGLYYFRARYYDPVAGRFTSLDPRGFGEGTNLYRYANNDPLRWIDPHGTGIGIAIAVGVAVAVVAYALAPPAVQDAVREGLSSAAKATMPPGVGEGQTVLEMGPELGETLMRLKEQREAELEAERYLLCVRDPNNPMCRPGVPALCLNEFFRRTNPDVCPEACRSN